MIIAQCINNHIKFKWSRSHIKGRDYQIQQKSNPQLYSAYNTLKMRPQAIQMWNKEKYTSCWYYHLCNKSLRGDISIRKSRFKNRILSMIKKKSHLIVRKDSIHLKEILIPNISACNNRAPKCMENNMINPQINNYIQKSTIPW